MNARPSSRLVPMLVAAGAAILVAAVGATMTDIGPWYQGLAKPSWQPPDWLFGPAWTVIFSLAALSAVTAWRDAPDQPSREWMVGLFAVNGVLNILWSALFFRLRRPDWALVEVVFLWLSVLLLILVLRRYSRTAALLLLPYLAWVGFAAVLNLAVVRLNAPFA
ncbi:tryptophan-rich sensory protein [Elioraea tepida]|jgi:tryptophan-rich sensory protein|uniref:Tryptophan-rich sensory protein n=1 Tax=Elioraea tepida TaxID=2843330 RepID=A0A975YK19_9PROT|nr:TspO/MBR family protein [Elioraea tepida]QXM25256.1 tryptophan-rich sensory protein [Elioraea tepida]